MQTRIIWAVIILCGIGLGLIMTFMMERYDTEIWVGASKEARRNPFLAAQQFLEKQGTTVVSSNEQLDFSKIPTTDTVFIAKVDSVLVSETQVNKALNWIYAGGYMIVGVGAEITGHNTILDTFEIDPELRINGHSHDDNNPKKTSEQLRELNRQIEEREKCREIEDDDSVCDDEEIKTAEETPFDRLNTDSGYEYFAIELSEPEDKIHLAILDDMILAHPMVSGDEEYENDAYSLKAWANDEKGERLVQIAYGEGTFTALSSSKLWENDYIGLADHAYLLSHLMPNESNLHLYYNANMPSLLTLIYRYFYELVWAGLVLLAFWLWARAIRTQPKIEVQEGQRRDFAEHLASSAAFLTNAAQFGTLLKPLQEEIEQRMRPQVANYAELEPAAQVAMLMEKTELPEATLQQWVAYTNNTSTNNIANQEELFAALNIGNAIRKTL